MAGRARRVAGVLPQGTGTVGVWVAASGVLTYLFLATTGRALGPHESSGLSTLWVVGFLLGNAAGQPVEQEVARAISSRRAQGLGVGPVVRRAAIASAGFTAMLVVVILALGSVLTRKLFGDDWVLLIAFVGLFVGTVAEFLVRGLLAGEARFGAYGRLLGAEAASRLVAVVALAIAGVEHAGPYGLVLALAPFIGIAVGLSRGDRAVLVAPGPPSPWRELTRSLGWLLGASVFAQALVNLGPVFVRLLSPRNAALTSAFVACLIVARVPVFLFQAAQAALVPRLSHHVGGGQAASLAEETRALARALAVLVVVATIGAAALGPTVVELGWGPGFALGARDFGLLAAGSCVYLLAVTFGSALVALECPNRVSYAWASGVVVLALCVVLGDDVLTRVEVGFVAGAATSALVMGLLVRGPLRRAKAGDPVPDRAPRDY